MGVVQGSGASMTLAWFLGLAALLFVVFAAGLIAGGWIVAKLNSLSDWNSW